MNRPSSPYCFLLINVSIILLTGCLSGCSTDAADNIVRFVPQAVAAQDGGETVIRVQSSVQQLIVDDEATVEIHIDNGVNLAAAEVQLQFDPVVLQVQDADLNKDGVQIQPGNFPVPDFVATNIVSNTTGMVQYAIVQLPPTEPVNGSGLLASLTLQAIAPGNSELTFSKVTLVNSDGQEIPITTQPSQITVGQDTEPTAILTPTSGPDQATPTSTTEPTAEPSFTPTPTTTLAGSPTPTLLPSSPTAELTFTPAPTTTIVASPTPIPTSLPPSTDTPIPPPPGTTIGFCYRVQEGDTLYNLGQAFGINPQHINIVNDLYPPGQIVIHQVLFIPEQYGHGPNVYIVKPGDTLIQIAEGCHLPVSFLASANNLDENTVLQNGQVLKIPIPPFPPPSRFPYPLPIVPWPAPVPPRSCDYVVQPGDTLYSLGQRYGISPYALARANNINNPHQLYAGQCLTLSGY